MDKRPPTWGEDDARSEAQHFKQALEVALKDTGTLRVVVKNLEKTIAQLQEERSQLAYEVQDARHYATQREEEIERLSALCDAQSASIQRMATKHAEEIVALQQVREREASHLRVQVERLSDQLSLSQAGPCRDGNEGATTPRPLTWNIVAKHPLHPIHTIRRVVQFDQRREELGLHGTCVNAEDSNGDDDTSMLDFLLEERGSQQGHSEDDTTWRSVCRRLHQVLSDRRRVHHLLLEESPVDFLLRTRHILVAEWVALHADIVRLEKNMISMVSMVQLHLDRGAVVAGAPGGNAFRKHHVDLGRHLEALVESMTDVMAQYAKVEASCFSDVDRALHRIH